MKIRLISLGAALAAGLALASPAAGHVTVNPEEWAADDFARFDIRVPTERDVPTTKVSMQLPDGLFFVSFQPKPGWTREVKMEKLDKPVELFGDKVTERVASVTWTGGEIQPGEFDEFGMSAKLPNRPGSELTFPSLQTYANGEVVRWIGPADSEEPAPRVSLTEPEAAEASAGAEEPAPASGEDDDDGGSDGLAIAALIVGAAGLAAGLTALFMGRRARDRVGSAS